VSADQRNDISKLFEEKPVLPRPDSELVEAAVNGDADSFTQLCRRYYPAMVAIAHSLLGDRHLAEDAAQQAFANAVRRLPQLRRKKRVAAWLAAICRNAANDMAHDKPREHSSEHVSQIPAESPDGETAEAVRKAIAALSPSAREVIFLRYYDGMSYEKISAVLGISQQAINGRLRRAKKRIAEYLGRNGFGEV
jgi:RNA polymerase sigma-70 factor (ECF subfamily)